jgi:hypothetical protein
VLVLVVDHQHEFFRSETLTKSCPDVIQRRRAVLEARTAHLVEMFQYRFGIVSQQNVRITLLARTQIVGLLGNLTKGFYLMDQ